MFTIIRNIRPILYKDNIAVKCLKTLNTHINYSDFDYILEPSAEVQVHFYKLLPIDKRIGLDLEPKYEGIRQLNFFDFKPEKDKVFGYRKSTIW